MFSGASIALRFSTGIAAARLPSNAGPNVLEVLDRIQNLQPDDPYIIHYNGINFAFLLNVRAAQP